MEQWEIENMHDIVKWTAEWDVMPGYKVVTFLLRSGQEVRFENKIN